MSASSAAPVLSEPHEFAEVWSDSRQRFGPAHAAAQEHGTPLPSIARARCAGDQMNRRWIARTSRRSAPTAYVVVKRQRIVDSRLARNPYPAVGTDLEPRQGESLRPLPAPALVAFHPLSLGNPLTVSYHSITPDGSRSLADIDAMATASQQDPVTVPRHGDAFDGVAVGARSQSAVGGYRTATVDTPALGGAQSGPALVVNKLTKRFGDRLAVRPRAPRDRQQDVTFLIAGWRR